MTIILPNPQSKKWVQANNSDMYGTVVQTKNITFDNEGYIQLSHSPRAVMNETVDVDFDEPAVIVRSQDHGYWVETHGSPFEVDERRILGVRPTQDADAGTPDGDLQSDAVFNSGLMVVTQSTDVDYYNPSSNTWTDTNITLTNTTGSQHPIKNFISMAGFAVCDVNTVKLYSNPPTATPTLLKTLTIPADFYITSACYFNQNLYIGTMNRFGGHAYLFIWNGLTTGAQAAYEVDSVVIFDVCVFQDSVALLTGAGQILRWVGSGFSILDNLPIYYANETLADETNISTFKNCLKSNGELLYINISNDTPVNLPLNMPAGVWCYDAKLKFAYHRYSPSGALVDIDAIPTADVNTTTDVITVTTAPPTGTEVLYNSGGGTALAPLIDGKKYYVIKASSTTIKLATTYANAIAGTAIDLTGTGNLLQSLCMAPNTDFGQFATGRMGALLPIERPIDDPQFGIDVLFGGEVSQHTTSTAGTLCTVSTALSTRGYLVTPWFTAGKVQDAFHHLAIKYSKFKGDNDKIVVKYRLFDDRRETILNNSSRWLATWTSTTTFTTTEAEFDNAQVGDEIEFLKGAGAGMLAHISSISGSGTYTVTLDEPFVDYTAGDTCRFVFRNFKKLATITAADNGSAHFWEKSLGKSFSSTRIQFKLELRGVGVRIEEIQLNNAPILTVAK